MKQVRYDISLQKKLCSAPLHPVQVSFIEFESREVLFCKETKKDEWQIRLDIEKTQWGLKLTLVVREKKKLSWVSLCVSIGKVGPEKNHT